MRKVGEVHNNKRSPDENLVLIPRSEIPFSLFLDIK